MRVSILVCAAFLFHSALLFAQTTGSASLTGAVTDSSGAVVAGVDVEARIAGEERRATTDAAGRYELTVPAGDVEVTFLKAGFQPDIVRLRLDGRLTHDVVLQVGAFADATMVTATRTELPTSQLTGSVTIFDAAEIRARGARSLAEVMQQTPGLQIEATGREGALTSLFARGGESDYNLVLVDGVRVTLPGGRFDFGRIDGTQIERVEVVRGSESALYGSDAIGAVVQVFTKQSQANGPLRLYGTLDGGSFGSLRGGGGLSTGVNGRGSVHIGASHRRTDGAFADILPEDDRFDQTTFDAAGSARLGAGFGVRASTQYDKAKGRSVGQIDYGIADTGTFYDTRNVSASASLEQTVSPAWRHTASVGVFDYDNSTGDRVADTGWSLFALLRGTPRARFPNSPRLVRQLTRPEYQELLGQPLPDGQFLTSTATIADFPSATRMDSERKSFRYQAEWNQSAEATLTGGYDYEQESDPNNVVFDRHNHAIFLQQQWRPGARVFLTAGGRLDRNSRYGSELSPKFSAGGFIIPFRRGAISSVKVQGNIGRGIKNPVFAELFGSASVDGNPALNPERARTLDAGAEVTFADQRVAAVVTYFANRYRDQVAFRSSGPGSDGVPDYLNIDGSEARGLEIEWRLQRATAGITASAFYTLVDTEVTSSVSTSDQFQPGQPLLRRPKHSGNIFVSWRHGRVGVNGGVRFVGQRHDSSFLFLSTPAAPGAPSRTVDITVNPGYHVAMLNGEYRVTNDVAVFARIDNLTDERYQSALGFPGLPRAFAAGVRVDFTGR